MPVAVWYVDSSGCQTAGTVTADWAACKRTTSAGRHTGGR